MSLALRDVVAALCVIGSTFFVPNARAQTEVEQRQVTLLPLVAVWTAIRRDISLASPTCLAIWLARRSDLRFRGLAFYMVQI